MLAGLRAFAVLGLIFGLLSLAGCVAATPAPAAGAPGVGVTPIATIAPRATAAPAASRTPASLAATPAATAHAATAQPSPASAGVGTVVVSSPVAAGGSGPLSSLTAMPPAGDILPTPANGQLPVTLNDDGATIRLRPGDRFVLMLGEGYDWQVTPADPNVVGRVLNIMPLRGSQGVYEARQAGQTTIDASGDPPCRRSQPPCMMPSRMFTLRVVVE